MKISEANVMKGRRSSSMNVFATQDTFRTQMLPHAARAARNAKPAQDRIVPSDYLVAKTKKSLTGYDTAHLDITRTHFRKIEMNEFLIVRRVRTQTHVPPVKLFTQFRLTESANVCSHSSHQTVRQISYNDLAAQPLPSTTQVPSLAK